MSTTYELYNNGIYENGTRKGEMYGNKVVLDDGTSGITYSTEVHAVGTWIDGRIVYEQTFYAEGVDLKSVLASQFFCEGRHCACVVGVEGYTRSNTTNLVSGLTTTCVKFNINDETIEYTALSSTSLECITIRYVEIN